jgi:glycosyltransferase involved in cell wall biosynthesis
MDGAVSDYLLLDVSRLVWRAWRGMFPTGIDRTCLAYVAHFGGRARAVVQRGGTTRILSPELSRLFFDLLLEGHSEDARQRLRGLVLSVLPSLLLPRERSRESAGRIYLNVGHTGLDKPGHKTWLARSGVKPVYFVHDLIPLTHPEYCRPGEPEKHLRRMAVLLRHAVGVIGNSRDTLSELSVFASLQQSVKVPPSLVAPLGVEMSVHADNGLLSSTPLLARPYFVMLGTIEGRKNHLLILNVWAQLARRLGAATPQLVIIGQRGWECEQAVDMLERSEAIRSHVIELSRCDDATLSAYMRGARALLFSSFVEGYGLPLVEALACGTPVIASDLGVFRELAGEIPDYFSPIDGLGWSRAIEDYAAPDSVMRAAQLERLSGWAPPTWSDHFEKVDRWLEQLVAIPPQGVSSAPSD